MPVDPSYFRGNRLRRARMLPRTKRHKHQRENPAKQMQSVRGRKNVEETAARIRAQKNASGSQLIPRNELSANKQHAQTGCQRPQITESAQHSACQPSPSYFQSKAAGQQNYRIRPKNSRHAERLPVGSRALAHDVGTGQRHEKHHDARKRQSDSSDISSPGNTAATGAVIVSAAGKAAGRNCSAKAALGLKVEFFRDCTGHEYPL